MIKRSQVHSYPRHVFSKYLPGLGRGDIGTYTATPILKIDAQEAQEAQEGDYTCVPTVTSFPGTHILRGELVPSGLEHPVKQISMVRETH